MGYGDGTIVREVSGRYRGARTINGTRVFVRGATRKEVRDKLRAREAAAASGLQAAPSLKLGEVLEAWLEEASPNRARVNSSNSHALRDVHEAPLEMERFLNGESGNDTGETR